MSRWTRLALALALIGCAGDPAAAPEPTTDAERAALVAPPIDAPDPEASGGAGAELGAGYRPIHRLDEQTGETVFAWDDPTEGPIATLVYVTRAGGRGAAARPAAVVFSSDPANGHFRRETSPRVTVRRLYKKEMARLLERLEQEGLSALPWEAQDYDADIGPERALYLYRGGKRRRVVKDALALPHEAAFTALERAVIAATMGK